MNLVCHGAPINRDGAEVLASWDCSDQVHADGVWERIDVALGRVRVLPTLNVARPHAPGPAFAAARFRANDISLKSRLTGFDPYEIRCELVALALLSRHIGFASLDCELSQMQVFINESTTVLNLSKHRVSGVAKFASLDLGESC